MIWISPLGMSTPWSLNLCILTRLGEGCLCIKYHLLPGEASLMGAEKCFDLGDIVISR